MKRLNLLLLAFFACILGITATSHAEGVSPLRLEVTKSMPVYKAGLRAVNMVKIETPATTSSLAALESNTGTADKNKKDKVNVGTADPVTAIKTQDKTNGNILPAGSKEKIYDKDGNCIGYKESVYTRNDKGLITKISWAKYNTKGEKISSGTQEYSYTYNNRNQVAKRVITCKNSQGKVTETHTTEYTYGSDHLATGYKITVQYASGKKIVSNSVITRDATTHKIDHISTTAVITKNGAILQKTNTIQSYSYHANGKLKQIAITIRNGSKVGGGTLIETRTNNYGTDGILKNGSQVFYKNGKLSEKRVITYLSK